MFGETHTSPSGAVPTRREGDPALTAGAALRPLRHVRSMRTLDSHASDHNTGYPAQISIAAPNALV